MRSNESSAHPWMANSLADIKQAMLKEIGAPSIEALFEQIPVAHRLKSPLKLPRQLKSEAELKRHLVSTLARNETCERNLSFLGAGCWQHHVPAVVDEIVGRAEFLTSVWGSPQSDHGRNQAWFEYASQLGELLEMDVVQLPVYSWGCAAGHAIRMAARLTGRHEVLLPALIDPERLSVIRNYCEPVEMARHIDVVALGHDKKTGGIDLKQLKARISGHTAAVYLESPGYLGLFETRAAEIAAIAHAAGAEVIMGVDPLCLGIVRPPADLGADIAVGPTQPLGVHMNCGGGVGGFIASRDEERYVRQYNGFLVSLTGTAEPGEYGFSLASSHQTSYGMREQGRDWTGNSVYLWAIANAVYMSLLGPEGFRELGELILQQAHYAARCLGRIKGVKILFPEGFFKEFVVNFDGTGRKVARINRALARRGIFGGKDLSREFPGLGQSALYSVTEIHDKDDIDRLVSALKEVVGK
ncbi:MAG TPA: aminomethyl-transferring glycine dehydrogenase subunit GcvPA [Dongiaceae bacterium]|nr:aminomethyl-transferring glycine dehydrogenase subunit GcvPA [Dongiaceae bacterium]